MIRHIFFTAFIILSLMSCNNHSIDVKTAPIADTTTTGPTGKTGSPACYEYINKKDTVLLKVSVTGDVVTGTLAYNYFEKDKNTGTLKGKTTKDLVIADYTFMSEGVSSTRQVVFKKINNTIVEGYGEINTGEGKTTYKNTDSLDFSHSVVLKEISCE